MEQYKIVFSGYKDYIRVTLGNESVLYIKTTPFEFDQLKPHMQALVDGANLFPIAKAGLFSIRGIDACIVPAERKLLRRAYNAMDEIEKAK